MDKSFNDRLLKRLGDRTKAIDEKLAAANAKMSNRRLNETSSPTSSTSNREVKKTEIYTKSVKTTTRIDYFGVEPESVEDLMANQEKENTEPNSLKTMKKDNSDVKNDIQVCHVVDKKNQKMHNAADLNRADSDPLGECSPNSMNVERPLSQFSPKLAAATDALNEEEMERTMKQKEKLERSMKRKEAELEITMKRKEELERTMKQKEDISVNSKFEMCNSGRSQTSLKEGPSSQLSSKLARLANSIQHQEDDLRHVASKPKQEKAQIANRPWRCGVVPSKQQTFVPQQFPGSLAKAHPDSKKKPTATVTRPNQSSTTKPVVLDRSVLANLEAQGFERCESHSNLAYDYRKEGGSQVKQVSENSPSKNSNVKEVIEKCLTRDMNVSSTHLSPTGNSSPSASRTRLTSPIRMGCSPIKTLQVPYSPTKSTMKPVLGITRLTVPSPSSQTITSNEKKEEAKIPSVSSVTFNSEANPLMKNSSARSSVRQLSSLYESSSNLSPKKPDPAELPLAQRKALFEKNKGAPVMPKLIGYENKPAKPCSSRSATTKAAAKSEQTVDKCIDESMEREKHEASHKMSKIASGKQEKGLSSVVAKFEQAKGADKQPDHIQKAFKEREREIDMLLHRFDSQKNKGESPVPVPPPLPPQSTSGASKPKGVTFSPTYVVVEEQYDGDLSDVCEDRPDSPVKSQQDYPGLKDTKKIRVSPPKPGNLYPNLSDMEVELDSDDEFLSRFAKEAKEIEEDEEFDESFEEYLEEEEEREERRIAGRESSSSDSPSIGSLGDLITITASSRGDSKKRSSKSSLTRLRERMVNSFSPEYSDIPSDILTYVRENNQNNLLNEFLDEALDDQDEDATPPKRGRSSFEKDGGSSASHSFEYQQNVRRVDYSSPNRRVDYSSPNRRVDHTSPNRRVDHTSPNRRVDLTSPNRRVDHNSQNSRVDHSSPSIIENSQETPLQHTISFYRRKQTMNNKTPISPRRQFVNHGYDNEEEQCSEEDVSKEQESVEKKIQELKQEIMRQETVIFQTSQALNLCISTIEFSSSTEQIEAERLLLVATHKRQALVHEVQRLEVEKTLRPKGPDNANLTEQGDLILSSITLPLKLDNIRAAARDEKCVQLICLVKSGDQVIATSMESSNPRNLKDTNKLVFPNGITLKGLYSDFKVTIEVYGLATKSKELLPHEIKYHISMSKKDANKHGLTPKKSKDDKLARPTLQSHGGPNAVRSPQFNMIGFVVFSLREINRTQFTLNRVAYTSVLEGMILVKMSCQMTLHIEHRGFLTMFDDISGMGAWHRRWSKLYGDKISYWKYPEDEKNRVPIDTIDLNACITETVDLVSRDVCARSHTFLLETQRPRKADDEKSLILIPEGKRTVIRHLLSADSKEERIEWCRHINKALALLRAWGKKK